MANVVIVSDWQEKKARRNHPSLMYNSTRIRDQTRKTTSEDKYYGGVKKAKHPRVISTIKRPSVKKAKHFTAPKQPYFYETLIAMAIRSSPMKALNVAEIHAYIAELYPYFKTCPGSLKASIIRALSSSTCFEKLGEPCQHYWTLTSKAKTGSTKEPKDVAKNWASYSQQTNQFLFPAHPQTPATPFPQRTYIHCPPVIPPTAAVAHSQATISPNVFVGPYTRADVPFSAHWNANLRQGGLTHDDLLRRYIHHNPLYPRVSVVIPTHQRHQDESGIKISQVFALNSRSMVLSRSPTNERLSTKIVPYHPCTFRMCHCTHNSSTLSSLVSEDKDRFEDA